MAITLRILFYKRARALQAISSAARKKQRSRRHPGEIM
jgi:hypothetical protein